MLLTEEEWGKQENNEEQLLLTKEELIKRKNLKGRGTSSYQGVRDKRRVRCFNCYGYGHFAAECRKQKRDKKQKAEVKTEVHLTQVQDDEPALLLTECEGSKDLLLNETDVVPKLNRGN